MSDRVASALRSAADRPRQDGDAPSPRADRSDGADRAARRSLRPDRHRSAGRPAAARRRRISSAPTSSAATSSAGSSSRRASISASRSTAVAVTVVIGTFLGAAAGWAGGWTDRIVGRLMDTIMAFPLFVLAVGIAAGLGNSVSSVVIATVIVNLPLYTRQTRSEVEPPAAGGLYRRRPACRDRRLADRRPASHAQPPAADRGAGFAQHGLGDPQRRRAFLPRSRHPAAQLPNGGSWSRRAPPTSFRANGGSSPSPARSSFSRSSPSRSSAMRCATGSTRGGHEHRRDRRAAPRPVAPLHPLRGRRRSGDGRRRQPDPGARRDRRPRRRERVGQVAGRPHHRRHPDAGRPHHRRGARLRRRRSPGAERARLARACAAARSGSSFRTRARPSTRC